MTMIPVIVSTENGFPPARNCFMREVVALGEHSMDVAELEDLIDRLGEDPSRWPDDRRLAAERLLQESAAARALLAQVRAVREALSAPPVRAPAGLADRIVAVAVRAETAKTTAKTEPADDRAPSEPATPHG